MQAPQRDGVSAASVTPLPNGRLEDPSAHRGRILRGSAGGSRSRMGELRQRARTSGQSALRNRPRGLRSTLRQWTRLCPTTADRKRRPCGAERSTPRARRSNTAGVAPDSQPKAATTRRFFPGRVVVVLVRLDRIEPGALPPTLLVQQHGAQLGSPSGGSAERREDDRALVDRQREQLHVAVEGDVERVGERIGAGRGGPVSASSATASASTGTPASIMARGYRRCRLLPLASSGPTAGVTALHRRTA